jgi:flagellar assembly protein FliH
LDAVRQEGFAEGFVQGQAQTRLEAQRQIADFIANQGQEAAQNFTQLFASVQAQQSDTEQVMARGVLELACELARQVLRHELSGNPKVLQPVIREALGLLVAENKSALVRLNPLDLEALEEVLRAEFPSLSLTLLADASLTRGGCVVESAGTVVDGTVEKRWLRAIASLGLNWPWEELVVQP